MATDPKEPDLSKTVVPRCDLSLSIHHACRREHAIKKFIVSSSLARYTSNGGHNTMEVTLSHSRRACTAHVRKESDTEKMGEKGRKTFNFFGSTKIMAKG